MFDMRLPFAILGIFSLFFTPNLLYGKPMNPIFPGAARALENPTFGSAQTIQMPTGRIIYLIESKGIENEKPKGIVLYFHGNGEMVEDLSYLLPFFQKAKLNAYFIEYPGYGHAPGVPSEKEIYATALAAFDWVRKKYPTTPIIAMGWSLGSAVAAKLALEREVSYLLLLSAMTSMKDVILRLFPSVPEALMKENEFDTALFVKKLKAPVTLIHGEVDDLVPFQMGLELKRLFGPHTQFISIPGAAHNDLYPRGAKEIESELLRIVSSFP
jgi:pimeloyl-ACP methyl ester carboxylesterase